MTRKFYLFTVMTALFLLASPSLRAEDSGTCGDNITWTLDAQGVLTLEGTGAMTGFSYYDSYWNGKSFTKVVIKEGITEIGDFAFKGYTGDLQSVEFPSTVTKIGNSAFYNCSKLERAVLPDSLKEIGSYAFKGCSSLTYIRIPKGVTLLDEYQLENCTSLALVECLAENPPTAYISTFSSVNCETCVLSVPKNSIEAYKGAYGWKDFTNIEALQAKVVASGTCGESVTWSLDDEGVLTIEGTGAMEDYGSDNGAPWADMSVKSVVIGEGVTSIGSYAFRGCDAMTSVDIAGTVTSIGEYAFRDCEGLTSVTLPNSVTSVGMMAFGKCSGLTSVTLSNSLTSMGSYMFYKCEGLTSVTIPSTVKSIAEKVFSKCSGLTKIECLAGETPVCDDKAFDDLNLEKCVLYVPKASIEAYKAANVWKDFTNIEALTAKVVATGDCGESVTWSLDDQGVLTIEGTGAMDNYYSMDNVAPWRELYVTSVVIGDGVTTIGDYAFYRKSDITSVTIPSSVTSIQQFAFCYCSGLTSVDISNSVTSIGSYAFYGTGLTSVTVPSSITEIENSVFDSCTGLKSVIIPGTITKIGGYAFYRCTSLEKIECLAVTPPACESTTFYETDKSKCELIVPKGSVEDYKTAGEWKDFYSIVAGINGMSQDSKVAVSASNGVITVSGVAANTVVEVYSISGTLVYSGTASTVAVPSAGIYVVKAAGKTVKVNAAK